MESEEFSNSRKQQEIDLHNRLRDENLKSSPQDFKYFTSNRKFYSVARTSEDFYRHWLKERCPGKKVLDYCCGNGDNAILVAKCGGQSIGIDISDLSIDNSRKTAKQEGVEKSASFLVMDAEDLKFPENHFDIIICAGVLHHLDLPKAFSELVRVLKPQGEMICIEALVHNPFIHYYRKRTPHLRTVWETEHILGKKDIQMAAKYFGCVEVKFYHFFTILAVPFRSTPIFKPLLTVLEKIDSFVLRLPGIKWWAWQTVFILSKPLKDKVAAKC